MGISRSARNNPIFYTRHAEVAISERGTMENLLAMPASPLEIMLGKILPYFVGAVQVAVVLGASSLVFGVPFVGNLYCLGVSPSLV